MVSKNELKYYSSLRKKKFRDEESKFLIEGFHLVGECLNSSFNIEVILLSNSLDKKDIKKVETLASEKKVSVEFLPEKTIEKLSDTEQTQGIIGVVNKPKAREIISGDVIVALERINDPGNLGTIIRTAYWFGIETVLISEGSADVYNPKVQRSAQGATFYVNVVEAKDFEAQLNALSDTGYGVYLLTPDAKDIFGRVKISEKSVLVFGNEAEGISKSLQASDYTKLKIKGFSNCESLNVAVSAGIVLQLVRNI